MPATLCHLLPQTPCSVGGRFKSTLVLSVTKNNVDSLETLIKTLKVNDVCGYRTLTFAGNIQTEIFLFVNEMF